MAPIILTDGVSKSFEGHLENDAPDWLFHYTSQTGLIGIVENSELWATKVQYLNDATEFKLAFDLVEEVIDARLSSIDKTKDVVKASRLRALVSRRANISNVNIFVACFCESGDLLSQWRGYAGENHGFSLGMKTELLRKQARKFNFSLARCIYDRSLQIKIIEELIDSCVDVDHNGTAAFEFGLLRVGAFIKDASFSSEAEWRIVSPITDARAVTIFYRSGKSMPLPYLKMALGDGAESPIRSAIVGPCPHGDLSQAAVASMFIKHRLSGGDRRLFSPDVSTSKVPYRDW